MESSNFDPTDLTFQVDLAFSPDKGSTWTFEPKNDGWTVSHNALRGDLKTYREALEAAKAHGESLKEWEAACLQTAATAHLKHIHAHHLNEDHLFGPFFTKRFKLMDKALMTKLEAISKLVEELAEGKTVDALLTAWIVYQDSMLPHLLDEETRGLALHRAYFTPAEIKPIVAELVKQSPTHEIGSIIHFNTMDCFRHSFMLQEGIPFFVWYIDFQFKYNRFLDVFVKPLDAVKTGVEFVREPNKWERLMALIGM